MHRSDPVDGFRLAYDRAGSGPAVLLLHGWPGDRTDYRAVMPRVTEVVEAVVPDLRGSASRTGTRPSRAASTPRPRRRAASSR